MNHSFDVDIACELGILPATIFNTIGFWLTENASNGRNYHDGRYWTFNSVRAWSELFPYASQRQVEKALAKLREAGYLMTGDYNEDRRMRTLWYTMTDKGMDAYGLRAFPSTRGCIPPEGEMHSTTGGNESIYITDSNTDELDIPQEPKSESAPKKRKRAVFVPPTPDMVTEYAESRGASVDGDHFCDYYASRGWMIGRNKMKDWKAAVRTWIRNAKKWNGDGGDSPDDYSAYEQGWGQTRRV